jgi:osmotically-inducible protein OsmY
VLAVAVLVGCSTDTSTHPLDGASRREGSVVIPPEPHVHEPPKMVPENPADRGIRRDLGLAIAHDAELKHRDISFIVSNGDVNVTGTVKSEHERERINELALNIDGVKSVANALRVSP